MKILETRKKEVNNMLFSTKYKMGTVVFRILFEAGYLESARTPKLQNVLIRPEIKDMLENTFRKRLLASMDIRI